jgi:hypothetical protein
MNRMKNCTSKKQKWYLISVLAFFALNSTASLVWAGPARAIIQNVTPKTADGKRLVGFGLVWAQNAPQKNRDWGKDINNLRAARDSAHYNCIRFCDIDWRIGSRPTSIAPTLAMMDTLIALCGQLGMYVILDYHCAGSPIQDGSIWDINKYWDVVAPRYKDVPWVMYEMTNESFQDAPKDTNEWDIAGWTKDAYLNHMRKWAPNTMIWHLSPVVMDETWVSFLKVYQTAFRFRWEDGKDVFAFHTYMDTESRWILELAPNSIPNVCSESGYPEAGHGAVTLDGYKYQAEFFARHDISTVDWVTGNPDWWTPTPITFAVTLMVPDALKKGYAWWTGSAVSPVAGNCLKQSNLPGSDAREYDILGRLLQPGMITHNSISLIPLNKSGRSAGSLIIR